MPTLPAKPIIIVDGSLSDWIGSERIDYGDIAGFSLYAQTQGDYFYFALHGSLAIGPNTTFWFNTDQNVATGFQIFGFAGGAEFNLNAKSDGTAALYTGGAGQTLVLDNIQLAYSDDHQTVEFAIPKVALGRPDGIDVLYDVNDILFGPSNYSAQPYIAFDNEATRTDQTHRVGIVWSQTTADKYFSLTAYSQLFMSVQSQAMQAGISFDLLTEADLTNINKLANYDTLVFPSFSHVQASQVDAITNTLLEATRQFGIGLVTAGNFMTNDATGAPLAGDAYARMKLLFDATRVTGGFPADVTITASDAAPGVFATLAPGEVIHSYSQVGWDTFQSVSGTGQTLATETVAGQTWPAILATRTGGKNVLFSTPGVMADNNLLWQAIDYAAKDPGIQVSLDLTRFEGIVFSRTDMDLTKFLFDITPEDGSPGVLDRLLPILAQWKQQFNFVGSYYANIGNDPANEETTNWAITAPYYAQLLAMGNELGTHSYTHPFDTNALTPEQIQFEFQQSKLVLEQQMSAYMGKPVAIVGAAVPGAPETLVTAEDIIQYFDYMSGGYSSVGAGYPGAFGFLTPDVTNAVYLAPNTSFDFTLVEYQHLGVAGAAAAWANEWNQLTANGNTPIVVWPWHDYAPTLMMEDPGVPSPYTTQLFTDWIQRAYQSGAEFVTGADLAARIESFYHSGVVSTVNGNVVDVAVNSAHAGDFALDLSGLSGLVIENVAGWYAYDNDSLFLPDTGGSFTITLGAAADNVTHITSLPMRGDLLSVTGDGLNLSFSMVGEGGVHIDLGQSGGRIPVVTGATVSGLTGDQLDLTLTGAGIHNVVLNLALPASATTVSGIAFSADTGASATDRITQIAAQTISGTLSNALAAGETVKLSLDNGVTWLTAAAAPGDTAFSLAGVTLTVSGTLIARVENAGGPPGAPYAQAYVLDQVAPGEAAVIVAMTNDSGAAGDFITNNGAAGRTVSGTITTALAADETLRISSDGGATWTNATVTGTTWSALDSAAHSANWAIAAQVIDLAGNLGPVTNVAVTFDNTPPAAPGAPDLASGSDSGISSVDNLTNVAMPTFTGTGAAAGGTVTLLDGITAIGTGAAMADGSWSVIPAASLAGGVHAISATVTDLAGNTSVASASLSVTIDIAAPAAPSAPDLVATFDSGKSSSDNITNITALSFKGTAAGSSTVTLYDGTAAIGSVVATAAGAWTIVASPLSDGVHGITAKAMDAAGNVSVASAALAVTVDTVPTAPSTPDMTAATDKGVSGTDDITNDTTPTFTGTAEAGSAITLFDGTTVVGTANATAAGVWTIVASTMAEGAHGISASAKDLAGNLSAVSSALAVTIDTGAPAPTTPDLVATSDSGVSDTDNITNRTTPTFSGVAEAGATVTLYSAASKVGTGVAGADGAWTITATTLGNGTRSITTKVTDLAGNISVASPALTVIIDTATATPARPDLLAASDSGTSSTDNLTNVTTPTFTGIAEAGSIVTLFDGTSAIGGATATPAGTWTIVAASLPDGVHGIIAQTVDVAGNASATSTALAITMDTQAPLAPTFTGGSATALAGKGEAGASVTVSNGASSLGTATVGSNGNWNMSFIASATPRSFIATQTDKAGNTSLASGGQAQIGTAVANTLTGTTGDDLFIGGSGADTFWFDSISTQDIIADFAATGAAHDIINFHGNAVLNSYASVHSRTTTLGSAVVISADANHSLTLNNVNKANLTEADFTFA